MELLLETHIPLQVILTILSFFFSVRLTTKIVLVLAPARENSLLLKLTMNNPYLFSSHWRHWLIRQVLEIPRRTCEWTSTRKWNNHLGGWRQLWRRIFAGTLRPDIWPYIIICCVFRPAFGCLQHPKAGRNIFFSHFSTFFVHFRAFLMISRLKSTKKM